MKNNRRILAPISIIIGFSFLVTGCAGILIGAGAGAGAIAYMKGETIRTYDAPMKEVIEATQKTFTQLGITATETNIGEIESIFEGTMKDDSNVIAKLSSKTAKPTEVRIRVDVLGKEAASQRIHEEILKNLK